MRTTAIMQLNTNSLSFANFSSVVPRIVRSNVKVKIKYNFEKAGFGKIKMKNVVLNNVQIYVINVCT